MNYKEILKDKTILDEFKIIDKLNDDKMNHGKKHAKNVVNNMLKLTKLLDIDETKENYLCIACLLHDMGQIEGSFNHNIRSKDYAHNYLKNKINKDWLNKILSSIENHHEKNNIENITLFDHLVLFADKMDFTYKRLDKKYIKKHMIKTKLEHIIDIDYKIEDSVFKVIIYTDDIIDKNDFDNWEYFSKITKRIKEFASKIDLKYQIIIKNK